MGLFSFLKKAGSNIFGRQEKEIEITTEERDAQKVQQLETYVKDHNFQINGLAIEVDDDQVTVYGECQNQTEREKIILALGNIEGVACVDDRISVINKEPEAVFYEVKKGDSLSKIAKAHYGDPMKYNAIFEANKPLLKDPNLIYPGQVLRIPPLS